MIFCHETIENATAAPGTNRFHYVSNKARYGSESAIVTSKASLEGLALGGKTFHNLVEESVDFGCAMQNLMTSRPTNLAALSIAVGIFAVGGVINAYFVWNAARRADRRWSDMLT